LKFRHFVCLLAVVSLSFISSDSAAQCHGINGAAQAISLNRSLESNLTSVLNSYRLDKSISSAEVLAIKLDDHVPTIADDCNKFVPLDAFMHMAASGIMQLGFQYLYEEKFGLSKNLSAVLAVGSTFAVGVAKENWDQDQVFNCFSNADLFMNGLGIISGLTIVYVF